MQTASQQFSAEQRRVVSEAVAKAESKTSAEIVPVVATSSGRYDRAEDIVGVYLGLALMLVTWWLYADRSSDPGSGAGSWGGGESIALQVLALVAAVLVGFVVGVVLASRIAWLRRLFVPRRQMIEEVDLRANAACFDSRIHHTEGATGILIYLSLFERRVVVRADRQVEEKLPEDVVEKLCESLLGALREGRHPAEAFQKVIAEAGHELEKVLPRADDDVNELSDALVILD